MVNGSVRQSFYSQSISLAANSSTTFIRTHNFGYNPVVMMNTSQTNGTQNMENCNILIIALIQVPQFLLSKILAHKLPTEILIGFWYINKPKFTS